MNRRQWLKTGALAAAGIAVRPDRAILAPTPLTPRAFKKPIRLHSNENPYGPSAAARQAIQNAFDEGNLYPSSSYRDLATMIAEREGLTRDHVVLGAGSHEVLRMTAMAYGLAGGEILTAYPTYEGMERYATTIGAHVHRVPLDDDLNSNLQEMARRTTQGVKLVFLCNPNNPTGTIRPTAEVKDFCADIAPRSVVFIDEAYYELVEDPTYQTMTPLVRDGHNVIISRTFSKAYGLAGLRVGYGLARPDIAARLRQYRTGSSLNILGVRAAIAAYRDQAFVRESRTKIAAARRFATGLVEDHGHRCLPSHTNFIFFHLGRDVRAFQADMAQQDILVGRPFPPYLDWCRLSIGTMEEMHAFADAFQQVMSRP